MLEDNIVIVIDNGNYRSDYAEKVPFKAKVEYKDEQEITVRSITTKKEYQLYYHQVLESMDIKDIEKMLDFSKYFQ